jgi:ribonucleotide reductase alpha subunit/uncharacterized protein YqgQ
MTTNYIELIKRSPYYYQVDGALLENKFPQIKHQTDIWEAWKSSLPDYNEKEKVFLDLVVLEITNPYSFTETMRKMSPHIDKEFLEFMEKEQTHIEEIYRQEAQRLIIPTVRYWEIIKRNMKSGHGVMEVLPHFFLRTALRHYHNDWTATVGCFRNLLLGRILMGIEPYTKNTCFIKGTPIWTTDGIKPIEDVVEGDQVITHNGRLCDVNKTFKNHREGRPLSTVYDAFGRVATATDDHPFLIYSTEYQQILWKNVGELNKNTDYLMRGNLQGPQSLHLYNNLKDHPELNRFIHRHPRIVGCAMSRAVGNRGVVEMMNEELNDLRESELTVYNDSQVLLTDTNVRMTIWKWVLETNNYPFVKGWWEAFGERTYFTDKKEAEMVMMVLRLYNMYNYEVVLKKSPWQSKWCLSKQRRSVFDRENKLIYIGDKVFVRFSHRTKYICAQQQDLFVYTLNVDRDHSYTVNGVVVKNCMGLTPETMVLKYDTIVPIYELKPGDYILDKKYQKRQVRSVAKNHYNGSVLSFQTCCSYTASTNIYMKNNKVRALSSVDQRKVETPNICYYYNPAVDKHYSIHLLNFILKYLCDWDIIEKNGWCRWSTSISDKLFMDVVLRGFHSFQFRLHEHDILVQKEALTLFINQHLKNLLYVSRDKMKYFFSYLDRVEQNRLDHEQSHFCNAIRFFLENEDDHLGIQKHHYIGDIYDIDIDGDSFCTPGAIVKKDFNVSLENRHMKGAAYLYVPDLFFQKINIATDSQWEGTKEVSDIWQEIVQSQIQYGKPSIICVDRNKNECVSGDTRILTNNGIVPISSKKDEIISVWNGGHFTDVMITRTGHEKKFLNVYFSNGMHLTCTPYHKFFIVSPEEKGAVKKVYASELVCDDHIAPFQLPSISTIDVMPSSIIMTLEWIAKRCVHIENYVVLFDRDNESLRDILLDLQYCGLKSEIVYNSNRNEYELRIDKTRWNLLNYRHLNKNISYIEGEIVDNVKVVRIEEVPKYQESFCFHEPFSGTSIFEGVATGQCENLPDNVCVKAHLDISRFLKTNPFKKQLKTYRVIVYTTKDCLFSHLLRIEYDSLEIRDIEIFEEEWNMKRHTHALSSVPAIFLDNIYVGNFMDFWKHYICPVLDVESLEKSVYSLCRGLDSAIDLEKNVVNEFSFMANRPVVLIVDGFRETLVRMRLAIDETETEQLNKVVFETIYCAALKASNDMSRTKGHCVNSSNIISFFENNLNAHEDLRQSVLQNGLRNMLYIMTQPDEDNKQIVSSHYQSLKHATNGVIPNSLKKIYLNDYEVPQSQRLKLALERKKYNVVNDTFHLYLQHDASVQELSELQQEIWSEGFHTIQIHLSRK